MTTAVSEKCHTFLVDEPKQLGGNGQAASPLGHFLGGLIGCTQITLHTIAEEQQVWLKPTSDGYQSLALAQTNQKPYLCELICSVQYCLLSIGHVDLSHLSILS